MADKTLRRDSNNFITQYTDHIVKLYFNGSRITICLSIHSTYKLIKKCIQQKWERCIIIIGVCHWKWHTSKVVESYTLRAYERVLKKQRFWCCNHNCVSPEYGYDFVIYTIINFKNWIFLYNNMYHMFLLYDGELHLNRCFRVYLLYVIQLASNYTKRNTCW